MITFKDKEGNAIAVLRHYDVASICLTEEGKPYLRIQNSQALIAVDYDNIEQIKMPNIFNSTYQVGKSGVASISTYLTNNIRKE